MNTRMRSTTLGLSTALGLLLLGGPAVATAKPVDVTQAPRSEEQVEAPRAQDQVQAPRSEEQVEAPRWATSVQAPR